MSKLSGPKAHGILHHNHTFDVIIEKRDNDVKNLIVMQKPSVARERFLDREGSTL